MQMTRINDQQFAQLMASRLSVTAEEVRQILLPAITGAIIHGVERDGEVTIMHFGRFRIRYCLPAGQTVMFKPTKRTVAHIQPDRSPR